MAVQAPRGESFEMSAPVSLFEFRAGVVQTRYVSYAVTADGQRFLINEIVDKVLPASFAQDSDRLRRFEQEARATSALNHPNILTIYDIGAHEESPYIVAELLDGEELHVQLT